MMFTLNYLVGLDWDVASRLLLILKRIQKYQMSSQVAGGSGWSHGQMCNRAEGGGSEWWSLVVGVQASTVNSFSSSVRF